MAERGARTRNRGTHDRGDSRAGNRHSGSGHVRSSGGGSEVEPRLTREEREERELTLTGVAHGGEAVGRDGDKVTFASLGLPGERVRLEVLERKARFQRGRVTEVLASSPERVTPPCDIFGTCGGCHWQHAAYAEQLRLKTAVLRDQLERIGRFEAPPVEDAVPSPMEWHYRNRVQFVPGSATTPETAGTRQLCFQRAHSHAPVAVEHCYISDPLINRVKDALPWDTLSERVWSSLVEIDVRVVPAPIVPDEASYPAKVTGGAHAATDATGQALVTLIARERIPDGTFRHFARQAREALPELVGVHGAVMQRNAGGESMALLPEQAVGARTLTYNLAGHHYDVPAAGFFQVNLGAARRLVEIAVKWLAPVSSDHVVDAYGGVGTFALPLAARAQRVTLIESEGASVDAAARNAAAAGLGNVLVVPARVEHGLARERGAVDLALLDPPRRGCGPEVVQEFLRLQPKRIVYVSCEPSTLARDLRQLCDGGYRLARTCVVDMFPQTFHLETVTLLERR